MKSTFILIATIISLAYANEQKKEVFGPHDEVPPVEAKTLLSEFQRALITEEKSVSHRHSIELRELKTSIKVRKQSRRQKTIENRQEFFSKRKDQLARKVFLKQAAEDEQAYFNELDVEEKELLKRHQNELDALKLNQRKRLDEFKKLISQGKRPPQALWRH